MYLRRSTVIFSQQGVHSYLGDDILLDRILEQRRWRQINGQEEEGRNGGLGFY